MASCVVEAPGPTLLEKIESFMNDPQYRETVESSVNYNTRLCIERRLRMPFLDSQTGVAQNHSNLFMAARHRMPGFMEGQIYTYPSKRWRKKRRQYLTSFLQPRRGTVLPLKETSDESGEHFHTISTVENPAAINNSDEASKDSMKDEVPKEWYYDEQDMLEMEGFDEPDIDSDYDYEESYRKKKKRSKPASRAAATNDTPRSSKSKAGTGRGRKKPTVYPDPSDPDKPFACDICGARYKTRPGLTYHVTHSHKNKDNEEEDSNPSSSGGGPVGGTVVSAGSSSSSGTNTSMNAGVTGDAQPALHPMQHMQHMQQMQQMQQSSNASGSGDAQKGPDSGSGGAWSKFQDSYLTFLKSPEPSPKKSKNAAGNKSAPTSAGPSTPSGVVGEDIEMSNEKKIGGPIEVPVPLGPLEERKIKANPSPYCDFCLGDSTQNKKSGTPEELVSCSDCGRSGHPTCLQFTPNMIISVRKYRWQCIECKCCSMCGTSDNDDQLLFCDDCDRGYHMYCLSPPLSSPPEGSWSCRLCLAEFHNK